MRKAGDNRYHAADHDCEDEESAGSGPVVIIKSLGVFVINLNLIYEVNQTISLTFSSGAIKKEVSL